MKWILLFQFIFIYNSITAENIDTVHFSIDMSKYKSVAKEGLNKEYEKQAALVNTPLSFLRWTYKYKQEDIQTISVPIFNLKPRASEYKCGDNLELLIDFKEDPYFQSVFTIKNKKQVGGFDILDSYNESMRVRDSTKGRITYFGSPFYYDNTSTDKKILKYKTKNPNTLIFMIRWLDGFWVIKDGTLYKLHNLREKSANRTLVSEYGEKLFRDISNCTRRTGWPYFTCDNPNDFVFKPVFIKLEIKE